MKRSFQITTIVISFLLIGFLYFSGLVGIKTEKVDGVFSDRYQELRIKEYKTEAEREEFKREHVKAMQRLADIEEMERLKK